MERRRFLSLAGGGALAAATGVAVDNTLIGYGTLTGTNLREQDLASKVNEQLGPLEDRSIEVTGTAVTLLEDGLKLGDDSLQWDASAADVERLERERGLPAGSLAQLVEDVPSLWSGTHSVEAATLEAFFERAEGSETHAHTVAALRGPAVGDVEPAVIERFAEVDPSDPRALAYGLVEGFQEHGFYDAPRYVAGAVEDNVLWSKFDLRGPFESPTGFPALLSGENDGLFCYDFAYRSMEAFHAVPASEQTIPVVAAYVVDERHKHVYSGLATVLAGEGEPTLLVTFLDYTRTTTTHDFGLARVLGDDPNAYTDRHRTTEIRWNQRTYT